MNRTAGAAIAAALASAAVCDARAEAWGVAIEWTAPDGCPSRQDVVARVEHLLGDTARATERPMNARGVVSRTEAGALLRLENDGDA